MRRPLEVTPADHFKTFYIYCSGATGALTLNGDQGACVYAGLVEVYIVSKKGVCVYMVTKMGSIRWPSSRASSSFLPFDRQGRPLPSTSCFPGHSLRSYCSKRSQHSCKLLLHKLLLVVFLLLLLILAVKENKDSPLFQCPTHSWFPQYSSLPESPQLAVDIPPIPLSTAPLPL